LRNNRTVQVRFLLGPAGAGKTYRCLAEAKRALIASPEGRPLVLVTPKQTTYQLERQLLADARIPGYTRLHILSFERLANFVFDRLVQVPPEMLDPEGRVMVLRGLLARRREDLKLFRASARLTGFAQQLSLVLGELQLNQLTPENLREVAAHLQDAGALAFKLHDLATLLQEYLEWLKAHGLRDSDCLLAAAAEALSAGAEAQTPEAKAQSPKPPKPAPRSHGSNGAGKKAGSPAFRLENLWVDGFAEFSQPELDLLAALVPRCEQATITFCLDHVPAKQSSWLSNWSVVRKTFEHCQKKVSPLAGAELAVEILPRHPSRSRFGDNPVLQHLEKCWADPEPYSEPPASSKPGAQSSKIEPHLRLALCADREAEVTLAAHEILCYARGGGRYREVTVLVRRLDDYHQLLERVFSRYEIPFFLDRRESVSHHPLAELTRSALRTVAFGWQRDDWFAALKTGLAPPEEVEIDR
jgi:ATP-dependent helicase/nuclease subunit B